MMASVCAKRRDGLFVRESALTRVNAHMVVHRLDAGGPLGGDTDCVLLLFIANHASEINDATVDDHVGCAITLFSIAWTPATCSAATRAASFSAPESTMPHNLTMPPWTVAFKRECLLHCSDLNCAMTLFRIIESVAVLGSLSLRKLARA
jgi:hypothetical protein